jgi:hypothetical protein
MDRTTEFAGKVTEALACIVDDWGPDAAELVRVNNLLNRIRFTWAGSTVTYEVRVTRLAAFVALTEGTR